MATLILLLMISFGTHAAVLLPKNEKKPKTISTLQRVLRRTTKSELTDLLRKFVKCCEPNRYVGNIKGHTQAVQFLINEIATKDLSGTGVLKKHEFMPQVSIAKKMFQDDYEKLVLPKYPKNHPEAKKWKKYTETMVDQLNTLAQTKGVNLVWEKEGKVHPESFLVIGAHYDSINLNSKKMELETQKRALAANNNGTGVVLALQMIEYLSQMDLKYSVKVAFFDFSELGFLGARSYVDLMQKQMRKYKQLKFLGMINLKMLGQDTKFLDSEKKYGNMKIYIRRPQQEGHVSDMNFAERMFDYGNKIKAGVRFVIEPNGFNSSDHVAFWEQGFEAITFSQNWESDFNENTYQTDQDVVESLNLSTFYKVFRYITGAVLIKLLKLDPSA